MLSNMKPLIHYFSHYLKESILAPLFKLLEASFELMVPLVIAYVIDSIVDHGNQDNLVAMILLLIFLATIGVIVAVLAQYFAARAAVGFTRDLSNDLYKKVLSLPKKNRDQLGNHRILTRLSSDTVQIQTGINTFLRLFLRAPIVVFGALVMAFYIDAHLSRLFLIMIVLLFGIVAYLSKVSSDSFEKIRSYLDRLVGYLQESITGMRVIRAFVQTSREIDSFENINRSYQTEQIKAGMWAASLAPLTFVVVNTTLLLLIFQGNTAIDNGVMEQGKLIALINYLLQILGELVKVVMVVNTLNQSFISAKRVKEIMDQPSEDLHAALPLLKTQDMELLFSASNVAFSYAQAVEPALKGIQFNIKKGDFFGIIGGTGSGKTTLVELLLKLYDPSHGQLIFYKDGTSPQNLYNWRDSISLVPQDSQLFSGTIRSNLQLGLPEQSDEALWTALEIAQAAGFIREKNGLETIVEQKGQNFSGGQKQRLTIARALLQPASILILDDATSALDYLTEKMLLDAIKSAMPHKTIITVSQRANSLAVSDQILVLDKGKQVGLGTHKQLLQTCSVYREIAQSQTSQEIPT